MYHDAVDIHPDGIFGSGLSFFTPNVRDDRLPGIPASFASGLVCEQMVNRRKEDFVFRVHLEAVRYTFLDGDEVLLFPVFT